MFLLIQIPIVFIARSVFFFTEIPVSLSVCSWELRDDLYWVRMSAAKSTHVFVGVIHIPIRSYPRKDLG